MSLTAKFLTTKFYLLTPVGLVPPEGFGSRHEARTNNSCGYPIVRSGSFGPELTEPLEQQWLTSPSGDRVYEAPVEPPPYEEDISWTRERDREVEERNADPLLLDPGALTDHGFWKSLTERYPSVFEGTPSGVIQVEEILEVIELVRVRSPGISLQEWDEASHNEGGDE